MRLFQVFTLYPAFVVRLAELRRGLGRYDELFGALLESRYGAPHILDPCLSGASEAFLACGTDEVAQRAWAREHGMAAKAPLDEILLAQIEEHRTEVFYNLDPMRFGNDFLKRLPGTTRRTVAWRAAPSAGGHFLDHDLIVNNFPSILEDYQKQGARTAYLSPAYDPAMEAYALRNDRLIDVMFVGGYSRHHRRRAEVLERVAVLSPKYNVRFHLDVSRLTRIAEGPLGWIGPLGKHRRPRTIQTVAEPAVFGRDLYDALSRAKVVINCAIDMAGLDRGNLRIWEAMGCGAALVSDSGNYPDAMTPNDTFRDFDSDPVHVVLSLLENPSERNAMTKRAYEMIRSRYSKPRQWADFVRIVD
jgi:hypothetical protein